MVRWLAGALVLASIFMGLLFAHPFTADDGRILRSEEGAASTLSSPTGNRVVLIIGNAAINPPP